MSSNSINTFNEYKDKINERIRPFLVTSQNGLPSIYFSVGDAFVESANIIEPVIFTPREIVIIFGTSPFEIEFTHGRILLETNSDTINLYIKDMIFINCLKMVTLPYEIQVACILEEFVHAFLNVRDEELAAHIVCNLYDGVNYKKGKYVRA